MKLFNLGSTPIEDIVGQALAPVLARDPVPWYKKRHLLLLNLILLCPLLSSATGGYDGSLMNGLQSLETWRVKYGNPRGTMLGFVNAAQMFGLLSVAPFTSWVSDRYGRKLTLILGLLGTVVGAVIQTTARDLAQLICARWIIGAFGMFASQASPLLIQELAYPSHRGKLTSLYNTFFYVGSILASWSCYGVSQRLDDWGWRLPTLLQVGYPCVQFFIIWFVPESPRWLISKDRYADAKDLLIKYHAGGDESSELVNIEISEIIEAIEMEKSSRSTSWKELVSTPGNRKRTYITVTLGISAQWVGNAIISYYFTLVLNTIGYTSSDTQTLINGLLQVFNFAAAVGAALLVDKLGRRFLFLWSAVGMFVSYVVWTVLSALFDSNQEKSYGQGVLAFIFLYFFHYDIALTPLTVAYPTEIFPYYLRSKGMSLMMFVTGSALVIASFCNSIAMDAIGWKYYIVFCIIDLFVILNIYFFYPETKGHSLEEIVEIFDGPDAAIDIEQGGLKEKVSHEENVSAADD